MLRFYKYKRKNRVIQLLIVKMLHIQVNSLTNDKNPNAVDTAIYMSNNLPCTIFSDSCLINVLPQPTQA